MNSAATDRLVRCFQAVFPTLPPERIPEAAAVHVAGWDSMATFTLVTLIGEQFGVTPPLDQLPSLTSFAAWADWLSESAGGVS